MKIKCILTNSKDYKSFCGLENSIYTVKISKQFQYWYYDLCDMIDFYSNSSVELILDVSKNDIDLARSLYGNHSYDESVLREYEPTVMIHTTTLEAHKEIIADGSIKCWNRLKQQKEIYEDKPIGSLLGDIEDFSNYVMLSPIDVNNEIIVASKQKGTIDTNPNQTYQAGCRFYLNAKKLANDGLLLRDGQHIKVKIEISLDKYLIWYSTADRIGLPVETTPNRFFELSNKEFYNNFRGV
ncbi:MAG: hypothetical protein ACI4RF_07915 [Eubacterium sp.]